MVLRLLLMALRLLLLLALRLLLLLLMALRLMALRLLLLVTPPPLAPDTSVRRFCQCADLVWRTCWRAKTLGKWRRARLSTFGSGRKPD